MRSPLHAAHHMPSSTSSVELISMTRLGNQTLAGGIPDTLRPRQQAGKVEVIIRQNCAGSQGCVVSSWAFALG